VETLKKFLIRPVQYMSGGETFPIKLQRINYYVFKLVWNGCYVEKAFGRRWANVIYKFAYEFFIDVYVELFAVVGRAVAPFGVSMATASCVTLEPIATRLDVAMSAPTYRGWCVGKGTSCTRLAVSLTENRERTREQQCHWQRLW